MAETNFEALFIVAAQQPTPLHDMHPSVSLVELHLDRLKGSEATVSSSSSSSSSSSIIYTCNKSYDNVAFKVFSL
ncbi:hypothetical protein P8452_24131 [Trifolium repens]|nr:hypothetical protein P8452_24131 [Trifolium repens]